MVRVWTLLDVPVFKKKKDRNKIGRMLAESFESKLGFLNRGRAATDLKPTGTISERGGIKKFY